MPNAARALIVPIDRAKASLADLAQASAAHPTDRPNRGIISIAKLLAAAGTTTMVAMRRNAANESPSIISSSVMTSYAPVSKKRSTPLIRNGCLKVTFSRRERIVMSAYLSRISPGFEAACALSA
jgi:hypothetical protein